MLLYFGWFRELLANLALAYIGFAVFTAALLAAHTAYCMARIALSRCEGCGNRLGWPAARSVAKSRVKRARRRNERDAIRAGRYDAIAPRHIRGWVD